MGCPTETIGIRTLFVLAGLVLLAGCGVFKETGEETSAAARLKEYEASFRPSDYDQPLKDFFPETNARAVSDSAGTPIVAPQQVKELIQGYRVQILATTGYDDVTAMKTAIEAEIPDEWFYVVYDAPTYKLRGGNFIERYEADRFVKLLADKGYKDAWVVPERVYKNPGPRPAPTAPQETGK